MELINYKTLRDLIDDTEDLDDLNYTISTLTENDPMIERFKEQSGYKIFKLEFEYDSDNTKGMDIDRGMRVYTFLNKKLIDRAKSIVIPYIRVNSLYYPVGSKASSIPMSFAMISTLCRSIFDGMYYIQRDTTLCVEDGFLNLKLKTDGSKGLILGFVILEDVCYQTRKKGIDFLLNATREWSSNMKINGKSISEYYTEYVVSNAVTGGTASNPFEVIDIT